MTAYEPRVIERKSAEFWEERGIYQKAKRANRGKKAFYFLDGPPYTSGHIHIGTAWNKVLKDALLRYLRMRGLDVWDRAGYDMHGMPTERKVQHKLGLNGKPDIEKYGIGRFVEECERFSIASMRVMNSEFRGLGVWMDFDNAYMPITAEFIDGVWWLVKQAHKRKRLYRAERTMHWCRGCSTNLAKHELEYKTVKETSIFVKFKIKGRQNEFLIIWTTTPWTIPFNLGVMVHPELDYVKARVGQEVWVVAKGLAAAFFNSVVGKPYEIIEEMKGEKLNGLHYEHPQANEIEFFRRAKNPKMHTVVMSSEYVDLSAGTGLVHMAPGCGPEDYEVGRRAGLPPFNNLSEAGVFPKEMGRFAGWVAKKDDERFIEDLKSRGALIAVTDVEHEYAHCWRCHEPVIFRTTEQWFFKVEDLSNELKRHNQRVKWVPDWAGSNWFDSWLDKLRDNSITRQRYWGTPLPIWSCTQCGGFEVIGSLAELEKKAGRAPKKLHRPWIDELSWKCKCGGIMRRQPDILDVWIDAGSASWNCLNYPRTQRDFKRLFPPDFIIEGKDQIRGWFNLLMVCSMVAMGKPGFRGCYMHGFVQDSEGRKMSKSLGNIISPNELLEEFGADATRLYLIGGANAGLDLNLNRESLRSKFRSLSVLWNVYNYLLDYSKGLRLKAVKKPVGLEERYIISRLNSTIKLVSETFEGYSIDKVPALVEELYLELSRTYIQLTREKISEHREEVVNTIYTVLLGCVKLLAPLTPFIAEQIFQGLRSLGGLREESVHLCGFPKPDKKLIDEGLEEGFSIANVFIQAILSAREKAGRGVRWPLSIAVIETEKSTIGKLKPLLGLMAAHTNIKRIEVNKKLELKYDIKPNFKQLATRFNGEQIQRISRAISETPPANIVKMLESGKVKLEGLELAEQDFVIGVNPPQGWVAGECPYGRVYLHTILTPELELEGLARELMRRVQDLRKRAGLKKEEAILLDISGEEIEKLERFKVAIMEKCGAEKLSFNGRQYRQHSESVKVAGRGFTISFERKG